MNEAETLTVDEVLDTETQDTGTQEETPVVILDEETQEETVEIIETEPVYEFLDKPFEAYTVTEGILLLIFVILFLDFILNILRRWF